MGAFGAGKKNPVMAAKDPLKLLSPVYLNL